jgi:hypothetical protein
MSICMLPDSVYPNECSGITALVSRLELASQDRRMLPYNVDVAITTQRNEGKRQPALLRSQNLFCCRAGQSQGDNPFLKGAASTLPLSKNLVITL